MAAPTANTISKPYFDVPFLPFEQEDPTSRHGAQFFSNVKQLQVGFGQQVFRVDRDGMWAGAEDFASAPWKVDWEGNMTANSVVLGGYLQVGEALGDTQTSIGAGGLSAITANIGAVTAGTITGVTITGGTVQTSTSGKRVVMTGDAISIYNSANVLVGTFQGLAGTYASALQVTIAEIDVMALADSGASSTVGSTKDGLVVVDTGDLYLSTRKSTNAGGHIAFKAGTSSQIVCYNDIRPSSDGGFNLGNSTFGWGRLYLGTGGRYLEDNAGALNWNGSPLGSGTVTSIATSGSISGGTITGSGTITHLTTSGHKHVPSGGASSQFLGYSSDGTATWSYLGGSSCTSLIPGASFATLGDASFYWDEAYVEEVLTNVLDDRNAGSINVQTTLLSSSTGNNIGGSSNRFGTLYAVAMNLFGNAVISGDLDVAGDIDVEDVYFETGRTTNPTSSGQMNYYDGGSKGFRGYVAGFTGQFDMTSV